MEKSIQKLIVVIDEKIKIYGEESIEVKKYKELLQRITKIDEKLKEIKLDK